MGKRKRTKICYVQLTFDHWKTEFIGLKEEPDKEHKLLSRVNMKFPLPLFLFSLK